MCAWNDEQSIWPRWKKLQPAGILSPLPALFAMKCRQNEEEERSASEFSVLRSIFETLALRTFQPLEINGLRRKQRLCPHNTGRGSAAHWGKVNGRLRPEETGCEAGVSFLMRRRVRNEPPALHHRAACESPPRGGALRGRGLGVDGQGKRESSSATGLDVKAVGPGFAWGVDKRAGTS